MKVVFKESKWFKIYIVFNKLKKKVVLRNILENLYNLKYVLFKDNIDMCIDYFFGGRGNIFNVV